MTDVQKIPGTWLQPNQLMQLIQKRKKLAERLKPSSECQKNEKSDSFKPKISNKRRNPFVKPVESTKRQKGDTSTVINIEDDSVLSLIYRKQDDQVMDDASISKPSVLNLKSFDMTSFSKLLTETDSNISNSRNEDDVDQSKQTYTQHLPIDWSLRKRVRLFCPTELPTTMLKTCQMANSLTNFVRCVSTEQEGSSMDVSPATRFHQATYYWQHPHIPWMTLFPRNSKENNGIVIGEREKNALMHEWDCSFRGVFQLLRVKQCPYFYFCANNFTVLFRAAGIAGNPEIHALITPTTSGLRQALRKDGIGFTMPLKNINSRNTTNDQENINDEANSSDEEQWLESLGVDKTEIRRLQNSSMRKLKATETADDFNDISLVLIEGVECQGLFNFLLNAKHSVINTGRLAGVPPTILAPVAFPRATLEQLIPRSRNVRHEGEEYFSIEVSGIILPTFVPTVCKLLVDTKETFCAQLISHNNTLGFTKATQKLIEDPPKSECDSSDAENNKASDSSNVGKDVFLRENLSGCGLVLDITESLCRTCPKSVSLFQQICYKNHHGYTWS